MPVEDSDVLVTFQRELFGCSEAKKACANDYDLAGLIHGDGMESGDAVW